MASPVVIDAAVVRVQIERMKLDFPELLADAELLESAIEGETDFHAIVARLLDGILDADTNAEAIDLRVKNLRERQGRFDRRSKAYRLTVLRLMQAANQNRVHTPEATLSISRFTKVIVDNPDELPQGTFYMQRVAAPVAALRAIIEKDGPIPGAHIERLPESLSIRTK